MDFAALAERSKGLVDGTVAGVGACMGEKMAPLPVLLDTISEPKQGRGEKIAPLPVLVHTKGGQSQGRCASNFPRTPFTMVSTRAAMRSTSPGPPYNGLGPDSGHCWTQLFGNL